MITRPDISVIAESLCFHANYFFRNESLLNVLCDSFEIIYTVS